MFRAVLSTPGVYIVIVPETAGNWNSSVEARCVHQYCSRQQVYGIILFTSGVWISAVLETTGVWYSMLTADLSMKTVLETAGFWYTRCVLGCDSFDFKFVNQETVLEATGVWYSIVDSRRRKTIVETAGAWYGSVDSNCVGESNSIANTCSEYYH